MTPLLFLRLFERLTWATAACRRRQGLLRSCQLLLGAMLAGCVRPRHILAQRLVTRDHALGGVTGAALHGPCMKKLCFNHGWEGLAQIRL